MYCKILNYLVLLYPLVSRLLYNYPYLLKKNYIGHENM